VADLGLSDGHYHQLKFKAIRKTMSIVRVGSTQKFSEGWDSIFAGGKKAAPSAAKKSGGGKRKTAAKAGKKKK
jgi:hypothetical protein